jgi:secondary thiamine-phosphate synthase enzyme
MRTHQARCSARTRDVLDFVDLTDQVQTALDQSGITDGQVTVFVPEASCAILVNERESGLLEDIRRTIGRLDSNGSGVRSGIVGTTSVVLPAVEGRIRLGTWQRVLLLELESASSRSIVIQIVGE